MTVAPSPTTWVDYAADVGTRLLHARRGAGMTQEQVALGAGISTFTYQKLEKGESNPGKPANPGLQTLVSLALVLDVDVHDLLPRPDPQLLRERRAS